MSPRSASRRPPDCALAVAPSSHRFPRPHPLPPADGSPGHGPLRWPWPLWLPAQPGGWVLCSRWPGSATTWGPVRRRLPESARSGRSRRQARVRSPQVRRQQRRPRDLRVHRRARLPATRPESPVGSGPCRRARLPARAPMTTTAATTADRAVAGRDRTRDPGRALDPAPTRAQDRAPIRVQAPTRVRVRVAADPRSTEPLDDRSRADPTSARNPFSQPALSRRAHNTALRDGPGLATSRQPLQEISRG